MATMLLSVLLTMFHAPRDRQVCMERRFHEITERVTRGERVYGVPPAVLLSVGYFETHLGCDGHEAGGWGAPRDPRHPTVAGTSDHAAVALAHSYRVCGNWLGAITRFRTGLCHVHKSRWVGYSAEYALGVAERLHRNTQAPLPTHWRPDSPSRRIAFTP